MKQPSPIVVIGASAGGVEALKSLVKRLPADFPAALLAVLHIPPQEPSLLAGILNRLGPLPVGDATDGATIEAGHLYVGVPDRHLLVDAAVMRLSRGPKENRFRPSVDALFRSAAYTRGSRVIGVVLTGQLDDGASGLWAIKDRGGVAIVQSPKSAQFPSMPMSALQHVDVDHVVDLEALPDLLVQLARQPVLEQLAACTNVTCPECHGVLSVVRDGFERLAAPDELQMPGPVVTNGAAAHPLIQYSITDAPCSCVRLHDDISAS